VLLITELVVTQHFFVNWFHIGIAVDSIVSIVVIVLFLRGMVDWLHMFLTVIARMGAGNIRKRFMVSLLIFIFRA